MKRCLGFVLGITLFLALSCAISYGQKTACDNVQRVLKVLKLEKSVEIYECGKNYALGRPATRADGTKDNSLWNYIQNDQKTKKEWLHDNLIISFFEGHGKYSFRQKTRPSAQFTFHLNKAKEVVSFKADNDRFAPGGKRWITSVRHFLQELVPNMIFGKSTDQDRIARGYDRLYPDSVTKP